MIFPSCKVCFGRRGLKADKPSSVEVEVYFGGKRKWLSTGVAVFRNQWHPVRHVINHAQAPALNAQIDAAVRKVSDFILHCQLDGKEFSFSGLSEHLNRCKMDLSFFDFVRDRIAERCDIREVTRKSHRRLLSALKAVGAVIGRRITSHMARHTFAVWCLNHGVEMETLARFLRHSNVRQTQEYAKIVSKTVERAFDKLQGVIDEG